MEAVSVLHHAGILPEDLPDVMKPFLFRECRWSPCTYSPLSAWLSCFASSFKSVEKHVGGGGADGAVEISLLLLP